MGHSGAVIPPNHSLCVPNKNCATKKEAGSVPLEFSSRFETPKILIITPEFVSKNQFFADSAVKTFIIIFFHSRNRGKKFLCPPSKIVYARYFGAGPELRRRPTNRLLHPQTILPFIPHRFPSICGPPLNRVSTADIRDCNKSFRTMYL